MALFALYKTSHPHILTLKHHFEDITPTILYIMSTVSVIHPTLSMISQPLYVWYHIKYIGDILSTIFMTSYPLYMTTQHCELITPHSSYIWHYLCYRRRHIHSITPSHSLYDFTSTSGMRSQPLYKTSHQLYLCHHNLSTDITTTFVWHYTHYICDIMSIIYNIISTAYVITLFYLWQHKLDIWNHIKYAVQNIHCPCDITVTSLYHHTPCFESITPTLFMTSHST